MSFLWALSELRTPFFDQVFQFITYLGQEFIPIIVICALYWCYNKKLATTIGFTYVTSGLTIQGLKIAFRIPRPWVLDPEFQPVESAVAAATGYSFPSGHTQSATSLFAPLAFFFKKWWQKLLCTAAFLLVGLSRMYLGVHTPLDVCTAILLTFLLTLVIQKCQKYIEQPQYTKRITCLFLIINILFCVYAYTMYDKGFIELPYVQDCYKMAGAAFGFTIGWFLEYTTLRFTQEGLTGKEKLLRLMIGLVLTIIIYIIPKLMPFEFLLWKMLRYALVIFWIVYGYPYFFTHYRKQL